MTGATEKDRLKTAGKTFAEKSVENAFVGSAIQNKSSEFPHFTKEELKLGKKLGSGAFGSVFEVKGFDATGKPKISSSLRRMSKITKGTLNYKNSDLIDDDPEVEAGEIQYREFIAEHCIRGNGDCRYAVKLLKPDILDDPAMFIKGMVDMATETRVLSDTEHPNIIKLRALASISPFNEDYFLVLDRLYDTMKARLTSWEKRQSRLNGVGGKLFDRSGEKRKDLMEEIVVAGYDLSDAFGYLHQKKIVYRDIKPGTFPKKNENIMIHSNQSVR
jgi:serine/threonine protein kinase